MQIGGTHYNTFNTTNSTCTEKVTGVYLIHSRNTVQICQQIKILVLCFIRYRMVALLKFTDFPMQVSNFLVLIVGFKFNIPALQTLSNDTALLY